MVSENEMKEHLRVICSENQETKEDLFKKILKGIDVNKTIKEHNDLINEIDSNNINRLCSLYFKNRRKINELVNFLDNCLSLPKDIPLKMRKIRLEMINNVQKLIIESEKNFKEIKNTLFERLANEKNIPFIETDKYTLEMIFYKDKVIDLEVRKK